MDVWQLIDRDHANIAQLIREIPYASNGRGVVRSRERMLHDLMDVLELHAVGVGASLFEPLSRDSQTRGLIAELRQGHSVFSRQLRDLSRSRRAPAQGWLNAFEDVTFLVDQHLHRHVHELIPAARRLLSPDEVSQATRAFIRAKTQALQTQRRGSVGGILSSEVSLIATVAAVATGLGYLAWRGGRFGGAGRPSH